MKTHLAPSLGQRLAQSRLVDADQLVAARRAAGEDDDALAQQLLHRGLLTRFQLRQLRAGASNFRVDKYLVVDFIGRGGNSLVFKARHSLMPGRYVALKTLDAHNLHNSDEALARFRREIDILARLEHTNIVRALDVLRTRTQLFLVLEYIEGHDLGALVRQRGPLPVAEAVGYALQAAQGLAYAHGRGVVHRDLKPANLLLTREGVVKLSDLGLARLFADEPADELTLKGCCLGTPEFMAPEQAEDATRADVRSDLYSLGATLFHLLTAELPVPGSSHVLRLQRLLTEPPKPLATVRPDLPATLAAVVDGLRARSPADRPASAEEAIALLEPFRESTVVEKPVHWDARRRAALVLEMVQGKTTAAEASARYGLAITELERWGQRFLEGAELALDPALPRQVSLADKLRDLHACVGSQAMEIESLKKRLTRSGAARA